MAKGCHYTKDTIIEAVRFLERHRMIRVKRRKGLVTFYWLTDPSEWIPVENKEWLEVADRSSKSTHRSKIRNATSRKEGTLPVENKEPKGPIEGANPKESKEGISQRVIPIEPTKKATAGFFANAPERKPDLPDGAYNFYTDYGFLAEMEAVQATKPPSDCPDSEGLAYLIRQRDVVRKWQARYPDPSFDASATRKEKSS